MPATEDEVLEVAFSAHPTIYGITAVFTSELDYSVVQKINNQLGDMNVDNEKIRSVCDGLLRDYQIRDEAIVKETVDRLAPHHLHRDTAAPHSMVPPDLIDADGNLRAADIGIRWQGSETFLHGVKVVGPHVAGPALRSQPATLTPYIPVREHAPCHMSTPPPVQPSCVEVPDRHVHRATHESRQGYRPAARFNGLTIRL